MDSTLNFKTNIQLKSIIGKDLINDDNIAILELVKNSFDADAKKVIVEYQNLKNNDDKTIDTFSDKTSRLIIRDDGLGMNLDDIKDKWLNIAYSEKKSNNRQHNRMMAGAKGVGRFSCDRLGEYLNLYAKKKNSNDYILLKIDWKKFEVEDDKKEIQSINLEYDTLTKEDLIKKNIPLLEQGVLLEIIKLRSNWVYEIKDNKGKFIEWNFDKLVDLRKYLEKLINPNQAFEKNDFGIYLDAQEFVNENEEKESNEKFIGKIENTIFEKLDFKTTSIESEIINNGKFILTTLKDKGQTVFWIKEKNEFLPELKQVKLILYYLNPYSKAYFTKQTGIRSIDYGSVYVFLNGFRVPPYGQEGDDWLKLEQRKGQGYARNIGTRELVGRIEISDIENNFKVITSREGLERNESYFKLTEKDGYFFKAFKRLEKFVVDGLSWDSSIYDQNDPKFKEIENKIIRGEINESELIYREDDSIKKRRVYESIHSIISAKTENVTELYINEDLILDKINEEKINAEREFEQLISDFENKKIDSDTLNQILQKKAIHNKELEKQLNDFSKYTTNEATSKAIAELQHYKATIENQTKIIEDLKKQLEKEIKEKELKQSQIEELKLAKQKAEYKVKEEEIKRVKAEIEKDLAIKEKEKIKIEKEKQILFHQKLLTKDVKDLLDYHHVIGIKALSIDQYLVNMKDDLNKNKLPSKEDLIDFIENISLISKNIISLTNLATAANFSADADEIDADLIEFIKQYSSNLKLLTHDSSELNIKIKENLALEFQYHFKPIEIAIILDNIFSNSSKAKATEICLDFKKENNDSLSFLVIDNGIGIKKENQDKIFNFGYTTTSGSGMGLHHIKNILQNKYKGSISINKELKLGTEFILNFKK